MSLNVKTNFGSIHGRRIVSFKVSNDGMVLPAKFRRGGWSDLEGEGVAFLKDVGELISAHESFRRWKAGRKAWRTRRNTHQLSLPL